MEILERLRQDHRDILAEMDRLSALLENLEASGLHAFVAQLWDLVSALEKHEEFEEQHLLLPLTGEAPEAEVLKGVDRIRREHNRIFDHLAALHRCLSDCRSLPPAGWNEAKREEIRVLAQRAFGNLRDHIHRENIGLFFLAAGRLSLTEENTP